MPVIHDLNTESGRDFFALNERDLEGVHFVPFRVREGDEASCLNLNRAQKPRLLGVKPEMLEEYKRLHAAAWPEVLRTIAACNIKNYSIYYRDNTLFSYFEYTGTDFDADMAKMAADPVTQQWWKHTNPCQQPVASAKAGEWWANLEEVFHCD